MFLVVGSSWPKVWSARDASPCHQWSGECGEATGETDEREPGEDNRKGTEGRHAGGAVPRRQERGRPMERRSFEVMKILHGGLESNHCPPPVIWSRPEFPGLEPYEHSLTHAHFNFIQTEFAVSRPRQSPNHSVTPPLLGSGFCLCFSSSMNFSCISSMEPSAAFRSFSGKMSGKVNVWFCAS